MKRTISGMIGKGVVNHNCRIFHAANTEPARSHLNREYCNEKITDVYHELFDAAVSRYNAKQTRSDRCIQNYYEKICAGKQEKPFHELILQIGNKDDMPADSEDGTLAGKILNSYMRQFQTRNPNLRVFSAHLHMDEATPHLHIDFIPFTAGSKRGLDTRVSLKQALATRGFRGGSRSETEWNQWVLSEKEALSVVMLEHGVEWEQKGSHEKHLSVLDYKKQERSKEVTALENKLEAVQKKAVEIEEVDHIPAKPAFLDNSKVIVSKADFEDVKVLAQKQISLDHKGNRLKAENATLRSENTSLIQDNFSLRQEVSDQDSKLFEYQVAISQLQSKLKQLQRIFDRVMQFIEKLGLKQQLKKFLKPQREKGHYNKDRKVVKIQNRRLHT